MDLNSLDIPETNSRQLQRLLDQAYKGYVADLEALADEAADAIERQFESDPLFMRDVVEDYSLQAAQLADDYFSQLRGIWSEQAGMDLTEFDHPELIDPNEVLYRMKGGFAGTDWNGLNYKELVEGTSKAGLTIDDLWPDLETIDDWQQFIADMANSAARLTTMRVMRADPTKPKWARVPRGSQPCPFCVMLSTRGFAYLSEESADFGPTFHDGHCHCDIVCSWGRQKLTGFDPDGMSERWDQCRAAIEHRLTSDEYLRTRTSPEQRFDNWRRNRILAEMGTRDRTWVHDGTIPPVTYLKPRERIGKNEPRDLFAIDALAGNGFAVTTLAEDSPDGYSNIDILINASKWEIKSPTGSNIRTVESNLRKAKRQFGNAYPNPLTECRVVFNGKSVGIDDDELEAELLRRAMQHGIGQVIQVRKDGTITRIK